MCICYHLIILFPGNHDQAAGEDPEREACRKEEAYHEREDPRKGALSFMDEHRQQIGDRA